jgi:nicotinate-nucleotide pyrophosphorylase (carboxylating)
MEPNADVKPLNPPDFALLRSLFDRALEEDRADADITTQTLVESDPRRTGRFVAREAGVAAGLAFLEPLFRMRDPNARVTLRVTDGASFERGAVLADVESRTSTLLSVERTALDTLQRLSGIATLTAKLGARLAGRSIELADTRKTAPGWRWLEKYAVRCGGGVNHRMDLADAAMIKDNHLIARAESRSPEVLRQCIRKLRPELPPGFLFYVEVQSQPELEAVFAEGVPAIQLDGFSLAGLRDAVRWVRLQPPPHPILEATGSVEPELLEAIADTGVTRISVDALTTRAPAIDMRMFLLP